MAALSILTSRGFGKQVTSIGSFLEFNCVAIRDESVSFLRILSTCPSLERECFSNIFFEQLPDSFEYDRRGALVAE
jgi:hypothetical protein